MNKEITDTIKFNANKFTYLAKEYPTKKLEELIQLIALPGIDVNLAIWHAVDAGWLIDPSQNEGGDEYIHLNEPPTKWEFGHAIDELEIKLLMSFNTLAKKETDLQWEFLSSWLMGYTPRDTMIVLKKMLADGTLETYNVADPKDPESVYEFYTLSENRKYLWGAKSFKVQPTDEVAAPEDEADNEAVETAESEK